MPKTLKLLLTENVDNLGIVGDLVTVRTGYARNFLLPREMATRPSEEALKAVAAKRAEAERMLREQRKTREGLVERLQGLEVTIQRACNDQGHLYAAVTQQDVAAALSTVGYDVKPREVRLANTIKRIDAYDVQLKFDADLGATIKLWVVADRKLDIDSEKEEMEFDDEGNLIPPGSRRSEPREGREGRPAAASARSRIAPEQEQRRIVDWTKTGKAEKAPEEGKGKGKKKADAEVKGEAKGEAKPKKGKKG